MKFADYLFDKKISIICLAITELLIACLLWLINVSSIFIIFSAAIIFGFFLISLLWDFGRRSKYYDRLLEILNQLNEKTLLSEIAERPYFLDGQIVSDILKQNNKYQNDKIAEIQKQNREYRDFLDTWVHEIKTPITSARLIVENEKNAVTLKIDDELRKIEHYLELVLYYARSSDIEKDFRVEKTTLKELVSMALKAYSKSLIQAGGHIEMKDLDVPICADRKSCAFVIGQIISNAIKYKQENLILSFSAYAEKNRISLVIKDNGIGISSADLSRVFEKGFTGENGRRFSKSTGIGLYLCKRLCDNMNIGLSIDSISGKGTTLTVTFMAESLLWETGI